GPFSWTRSTPATASVSTGLNLRLDCDAPGESPNRLSAGQALPTNFVSAASAFGAMSVATTCSPLARNSAVQLAPMTPVPTMATRLMSLLSAMPLLRLRRVSLCCRSCAARTQAVDFGRTEAQLFQDLPIMLSELRRAPRRHLGDAVHLNRATDRRGELAA